MTRESIDKRLLQTFVPVNALSGDQLDWLLDQQEVCRYEAGDVLFRQNDRDNATLYLLSGTVELFSERGERSEVRAGDGASWHPLGHVQPRRDDCRALTEVSVVRFDSFRLDTILSWDQSAGYVILDINANAAYQHDREWMIRLLKSNLFHRVPPSNILEIFRRLRARRCQQGETIIRQGEQADCCYIIKEGVCEVAIHLGGPAPGSRAETPLALLEPGQWFGEEALLSGTPRNATVTMATDGILMRLDRQDFEALLGEPAIRTLDVAGARVRLSAGARWLDVRTADEFDQQPLRDALNMPLAGLRLKSRLLDPARAYVAYCDTGRRSATAAFLLKNAGLDVFVLDGGLNANADNLHEYLE
ncbi:cyclic nucleotide-binding domain-containing protein [Alloalcanivorax mobilis]|uniref:cyclic nucleotide-binding domain-containing protein n=1 Tax=Alloalcanivorax mobilis TaxID=2019569 RepID=UPI000B5B2177|nr:cyclic nucleotide-binding domain-containing protein [Alloalcanivorax mobilis]ASK34229.1 cyclic nucleotide-binding protein [Alcanivorax sp. N3-2A]|tara:strand:- start:24028 stop:25110 length:1083 start_codon:yes stop_codon:yes gene_type:complete